MRRLRFVLVVLGLALIAIPASATITYSYCTSGCTSTGGSYAAWQAQPSATGLAFTSLISFVAAGLNATTGIYTDTGVGTGGTGTVFTNFSSGGSVDTGTQVKNGAFVQGFSFGTATGFEIDLPANTYAFAMTGSDCSSAACTTIVFNLATVGLGTQSSHGTDYSLTVPAGGPGQFFGIISDVPISSLFFASGGNNLLSINSVELGEASPTAEGGTFLLVGGGLIALYFCRRRRRARQRPAIATPISPRMISAPGNVRPAIIGSAI